MSRCKGQADQDERCVLDAGHRGMCEPNSGNPDQTKPPRDDSGHTGWVRAVVHVPCTDLRFTEGKLSRLAREVKLQFGPDAFVMHEDGGEPVTPLKG